jgi:hypothetical protein
MPEMTPAPPRPDVSELAEAETRATRGLVVVAEEARDHLYTKQDMERLKEMATAALANYDRATGGRP